MSELVKVKYSFKTEANLFGEMSIPKEMFDRLPEDEKWSDEIEKFIVDRHDYIKQPPEIEPEWDCDFDDIEIIEGE